MNTDKKDPRIISRRTAICVASLCAAGALGLNSCNIPSFVNMTALLTEEARDDQPLVKAQVADYLVEKYGDDFGDLTFLWGEPKGLLISGSGKIYEGKWGFTIRSPYSNSADFLVTASPINAYSKQQWRFQDSFQIDDIKQSFANVFLDLIDQERFQHIHIGAGEWVDWYYRGFFKFDKATGRCENGLFGSNPFKPIKGEDFSYAVNLEVEDDGGDIRDLLSEVEKAFTGDVVKTTSINIRLKSFGSENNTVAQWAEWKNYSGEKGFLCCDYFYIQGLY